MLKKILIGLGIVVFLLLAALVILPIVFKPQIVEMVKKNANKNINAILDFNDVDLSFFKQFPKLTISIDQLRLITQAPFAGDTLASLKELQATVNLRSLIGGEQIEVNSIRLVQPRINLRVLKDGRANWDISKESEPPAPAPEQPGTSGLNLAIQQYEISDAYVNYNDEAGGTMAEVAGLRHLGKGDFRKTLFILSTQTDIAALTVKSQGIPYLNRAELALKADIEMDAENQKYTLKENEIRLNQLYLSIDGWLATAGEKINMDLTFRAPEADFKNILSMVPAIYQKDFADLKAEGKLTLNGKVQGVYADKQVPAFDLAVLVKDGMFQYPQLPTPVKKVNMDLQVSNPGKTLNETLVNLKNLHLEILNDPVDVKLLVKTPVSDPYIDSYVKGSVNLDEVKNIFPMPEGVAVSGKILSDFQLKGNISAIEKNQLDRFSASGKLNFAEILYSAPDLPDKILVKTATLNLSPQKAALNNFSMSIGKSDLQANGILENIFGYVFAGQPIKGTLALQSNFFDLNPWMAGESEPLTPVELPARVEFLLAANFKEVVFDNLNLKNVQGNLLLKDQVLSLMDLQANILNGSVAANGTYSFIPPQKPRMFFDLQANQISFQESFKKFVTAQRFLPIAEYITGDFSGKLNINSELDDKLMPVWNNFFSQGALSIPKAKIQDYPPINKVSEVLKISQLHNPALSNLAPSYVIKNGRFYLEPMTFQVEQYKVTAGGSTGLDKSLDYVLKVLIPAKEMNQQANSYMSQLLKKDLTVLTNETVAVDLGLKGTVKDPTVQVMGSDVIKGVTDPLQAAAMQEMEKQKAEMELQAKAALEKQQQELEKQKKEAEKKLKDKLKDLFKK